MSLRFDTAPTPTDIFATGAAVLVNPVNCVGVMGKGLAKAFADRYPQILPSYQHACRSKALRPGQFLETRLDPVTGAVRRADGPIGDSIVILNLATKDHWREDSRIEWIDQGAKALAQWIADNQPSSIAIPQLGAGNGRLNWADVAALIKKHLAPVTNQATDIQILGKDPSPSQDRGGPSTARAPMKSVDVLQFRGTFDWASNMYRAPVSWGDDITPAQIWPLVELPYVLGKTTSPEERQKIIDIYYKAEDNTPGTGGGAIKKAGSERGGIITLRPDWPVIRLPHMTGLQEDKYTRNPQLAQKLLSTGNGQISEGNWWGDIFWGKALNDKPERGIKAGDGQDHMGKILMATRTKIQARQLTVTQTAPTMPAERPTATGKPQIAAQPQLPGLAPTPAAPETEVVNLKNFKKPYPADVVDFSRYGQLRFQGESLGNNFVMDSAGGKDGTREDVVRKFAHRLYDLLDRPDFKNWLSAETTGKKLGCWCAPQLCHCNAIKAASDAILSKQDPKLALQPYLVVGLPATERSNPAQIGVLQSGTMSVTKDVAMDGLVYAGIGSRDTPTHILARQQQVAALLGKSGWTLRSGGADGADINFEKGCEAAGGKRRIFLPWRSFEARIEKEKTGYVPVRPRQELHVLDQGHKTAFDLAAKYHPKWGELPNSHKSLHTRNCYQVLDVDLKDPADVVICYTEGGQLKGGTAQALRIAADQEVPVPVLNMGAPKWINKTADEIADAALVMAKEFRQKRAAVAEQAVAPKPTSTSQTTTPVPLATHHTSVAQIPAAKPAPKINAKMENALLMR